MTASAQGVSASPGALHGDPQYRERRTPVRVPDGEVGDVLLADV